MPEQFTTQEARRDCAAVHFEKRPVAAIRALMDGIGHGFLARTRLAENEHSGSRRSRQLNALPNLRQFRTQGQSLESRHRRNRIGHFSFCKGQPLPQFYSKRLHKLRELLELLCMFPCIGVVVVGSEIQEKRILAVLKKGQPDQ